MIVCGELLFSYGFLSILCFTITTFLIFKSLVHNNNSNSNSNKNVRLPPSPPSLPIIGHLHHFLSPSLFQSFHTLSLKWGAVLYLRLGATPCLVVSSASAASDVFKTHDLAFSFRPTFAFSDKMSYASAGLINAPYGDYFRFIKTLCVSGLLGPNQVQRTRPIRRQEIQRLLEKAVHCSKEKMMTFEVGGEVMKLTNNVVCRMAMSTRCSESEDEAEKCRIMVKESFELVSKLCFGDVLGPFKWVTYWLYGKKCADLTARFDELLEGILKEHEQEQRETEDDDMDMMHILLKIHREDKDQVKITRTGIKALLADLFIAGTDTSADTIQWAVAELINHPLIFHKVRDEIETIVGNSRLVDEPDISNLPYLQAVVKETLRLHPPAPLTTRECRQQCKVGGYDVPEKTTVAINLYSIMRDPNVWDNPDTFLPERFLIDEAEDEKSGVNKKSVSLGFVPFGGGRRGCPGSLLAFTLVHSTVAAMVQCFDWEPNGERVDMKPGSGLTMGMAHPLVCLPVIHFNPSASN